MRPRAVIYVRVSSEDQIRGTSLDTQEASCREWCSRNRFEVDRVFIERGESAKTTERTEFQSMVRYCADNKATISRVVIYKTDRFARNATDYAVFRALLAGYGITIASATEPMSDDPAGKLMEIILAGIAQFDNDVRAERTIEAMRSLQERGCWTHQAPVGYQIARDGDLPILEAHPINGPVMIHIFDRIASGAWSQVQALDFAKASGIRISKSRLSKALSDPIYCGQIRTKLTRSQTFKARWKPLISPELFDQVQIVLNAGVKKANPGLRSADFPLRGLLRCDCCGKNITASFSRGKAGRRYGYYHCKSGCVRHRDSAIMDQLAFLMAEISRLCSPWVDVFRDMAIETSQAEHAAAIVELGVAKQHVKDIERKLSRLLDGYLSETIDDHSFRRKSDELKLELSIAKSKLSDAQLDEFDAAGTIDMAEQVLGDLPSLWNTLDNAASRDFLAAMFPTGLEVSRDGVRTPISASVFGMLRNVAESRNSLATQALKKSNTVGIGEILAMLSKLQRFAA